MEDKKAAEILQSFLDKYPLNDEEKEAVKTTVGLLHWASLAQSRIKNKKAKIEKSTWW
jgi:hypothetical protein